jgi:ribosomal protein S16
MRKNKILSESFKMFLLKFLSLNVVRKRKKKNLRKRTESFLIYRRFLEFKLRKHIMESTILCFDTDLFMNRNQVIDMKAKGKKLSSQILNLYHTYHYKIRLMRVGRRKKVSYKIVVVNWKNRFIEEIGSYDPQFSSFFTIDSNNNIRFEKVIKLEGPRVIFWLQQRVLLTPFVHKLFLATDLIPPLKI